MRRQSSSWPRKMRVKAVPWLFGACALLPMQAALAVGAALSTADSTSSAFLGGRFDSRDAIKQNAIAPMQGQTQMTDQNGNKFDATLTCGSAVPMLEVLGVPGATGDLSTLIISADLDLDGTFDSTISPANNVSGVCANGYISCDAGTWNNCTAWSWQASMNAINVATANIRDLKGCYCINNSCGSSLAWTNIDQLLRDLGTGVTQAIQQVKPDYVISDVMSNAADVKFYGASGSGCHSGSTGQQAYIGNSAAMNTDLTNEVTAQSGDPTSLYTVVTTSTAATASATTDNTCAINRTVPVTDADCTIQPDVINDSCATLASNGDCNLKDETVDGVTTYSNFSPTGLTPLPTQKTVTSSTGFYPAPATINYELSSIHFAYAETTTTFLTVTGIKLTQQLSRTQCRSKTTTVCHNWGDVPSCFTYTANFGYKQNTNVIWVSGGCRGRFDVTGLIPKPCGHNVTRDWWDKSRTYQCLAQPSQFNFDDALHRTGVARQSADLTNGFTETHKDATGQWVSQSVSLGSPAELPQVPNCEPVCKLKKEIHDDRVDPINVVATNRTAPGTRVSYRYAVCDANNVCPANADETIVKACQCVDDFAEAATIMQMLRQAGQDLICQPSTTSNIN